MRKERPINEGNDMRKQYKKARYKRAAARATERKYPGLKALTKSMKALREAAAECGRLIAKNLNKLLEGVRKD